MQTISRSTYIAPGHVIYTENGGKLTAGYPVYFLGSGGTLKRGFITAGHAFENGDYVYNSGSSSLRSQIGVCVASQFSGTVDAALIQMAGNYAITDYTLYGGIKLSSTSYVSNPPVGTPVYKEGYATQRREGVVLCNSAIAYQNSSTLPTIEDTILVSAVNLAGDSGGAVYDASGRVIGSASGSTYSGSSLTEESFNYCIVIKASNTFDALNCSVFEHPYAG